MRTTHRALYRAGAITAGLGLLGGLTACSAGGEQQGSPDNPVTITFWDNNAGPDRTPLYEELIAQFEEENPSIKVEYVGIPAADAPQKYETAVAGGSTPDVGIVVGWMVSSLAAQGALEPIEERLADSDAKIAEDAIKAAKGVAFDGELYIAPMTSTPDTLWYRTDLFEAAGLEAPETWDQFYEAAEALTDPAAGQFGFAMRGGAGSVNQLIPVAYSCSGIDEFFEDGETTLNDPKNVECIQRFADMYNVNTAQADVGYGYQEMVTAFDGGSAAMMQHNLGSAQNHIDAFGEGVVAGLPMPAAKTAGERTIIAPTPEGPAMFTGSDNPDAAWAFTEFLASHEANSTWNERTGQTPANEDARQDDWVKENEALNTQIEALSDPKSTIVTSPLYLPDWNGILGEMAAPFQSVLLKDITAQEFMDQWAEKVNTAEAEYREQFGD
ncbi:sugar ABC transporter substrate-binding protein [Naasia sp. SYSU D00057]|uniref:ABC transporter substrate-binding protein n=1 Tax=Naasia sp. SYSU D00057 TaxID=2817380 RepID=UPI001B300CC6|nr:sugar ABC transporter substrate-binding protein [Naasia sp. SYSU D00057]